MPFSLPLLSFVKSPLFKYLAILLVICGLSLTLWLSGYNQGTHKIQAKWDADVILKQKALDKALAELKIAQAKTNVVVETKYIDRIKTVKIKGDTIVKYIPQIITPKDDAACVINSGFERMYNYAASDSFDPAIPPTPSESDGQPAPVKLTDVARVTVENFTICHQNAEQLKSLQEWIKLQTK